MTKSQRHRTTALVIGRILEVNRSYHRVETDKGQRLTIVDNSERDGWWWKFLSDLV